MRVTCERCLRRYDVPDATVKGRKIRARCKCGARVVVQDEERAARSSGSSQTTGAIQRPVRWFVDITSWEPIAMDLRQLVRAFDGGRIDADTLVWRKGMPDWRRLRDVPELAERLMGAEAAAKASAEMPVEAAAGDSDPPPHDSAQDAPHTPPPRAERSRTPPANYSVGSDARNSAPPLERVSVMSAAPPGSEAVATLTGGSSVPPTPHGGYSPAPPRARSRPDRRSVPGGFPMPSVGGGLAPVAVEPRTITQTGLAPAPEPVARTSAAPTVAASTPPNGAEPEAAARASSPGAAAGNQRVSRNPTPAPGPRRVPSSDETPAQKPSSISVPSGTLVHTPPRPRGRHLVAIGVLLIGAVVLVRGTLSNDSAVKAPTATASEQRPAPPPVLGDPVPMEKTVALEPQPALPAQPTPLALAPQGAAPAQPAVPPPVQPAAAPAKPVAPPPQRAPVPATPAPERSAKLQPVAPALPPNGPILEVRPSQPEPERPRAEARDPGSLTGRGELAAPAPAPAPAPSEPATPPTAAPPAAAAPAAPAPPASAPSTAPGPFDALKAKQQMALAAFKASTCSQLGSSRGSGDVSVVVAPWGRVVKVTHLNQAFVGTPVGLCIMQAFQQVQVPPFSGGEQTLTGSFVIP